MSLEDSPVSSSIDPPLLTYHRYPRPTIGANPLIAPTHAESLSSPNVLPPMDLDTDSLSTAQRKGKRSTMNPYPTYHLLKYDCLSPIYSAFVSSLSSGPIPKDTGEA